MKRLSVLSGTCIFHVSLTTQIIKSLTEQLGFNHKVRITNLRFTDRSRVEGREGGLDGAEMEQEGDERVHHDHEQDGDRALEKIDN